MMARAAWAALATVGVAFVGYLGESVHARDVPPTFARLVPSRERPVVGDDDLKNQPVSKAIVFAFRVQPIPRLKMSEPAIMLGAGCQKRHSYQFMIGYSGQRRMRVASKSWIPARDLHVVDNGGVVASIGNGVGERSGIPIDDWGTFFRCEGHAWYRSFHAPNEDVRPLRFLESSSGFFSSISGLFGCYSGDARGAVGADEKKNGYTGRRYEREREKIQPPSIIGDSFIGRFWRSMAGAGALGAISVLLYCGFVFWLVNRPSDRAAKRKAHDGRE
jgi:hypothetical protein